MIKARRYVDRESGLLANTRMSFDVRATSSLVRSCLQPRALALPSPRAALAASGTFETPGGPLRFEPLLANLAAGPRRRGARPPERLFDSSRPAGSAGRVHSDGSPVHLDRAAPPADSQRARSNAARLFRSCRRLRALCMDWWSEELGDPTAPSSGALTARQPSPAVGGLPEDRRPSSGGRSRGESAFLDSPSPRATDRDAVEVPADVLVAALNFVMDPAVVGRGQLRPDPRAAAAASAPEVPAVVRRLLLDDAVLAGTSSAALITASAQLQVLQVVGELRADAEPHSPMSAPKRPPAIALPSPRLRAKLAATAATRPATLAAQLSDAPSLPAIAMSPVVVRRKTNIDWSVPSMLPSMVDPAAQGI